MIKFDPYDPGYADDPYTLYRKFRDESPVVYNPDLNFYALALYRDVVDAHRDTTRFSNAGGVTIEGHEASTPLLIVKDPPEHNLAKGLVMRLFTRARMNALDIFIRKRVIELLDELWEKHGPDREFNFVSEFTVRLPLDVISELLGIPEEYHHTIHECSNLVVQRGPGSDPQEAVHANMRLIDIYHGLAQDRRATPRDDVITKLIQHEVKDENGITHRMTDEEIAVRFSEMGFAGHETVAKAIPNGAMAFHDFPDEWRKLIANRDLLSNTVDEILRYDPPSQLQGRTTTCDVELHGVTIPAGVRTMLITGSATRDPLAFDDPDRFAIERTPDPASVFFGLGAHKCLGQHLARREILVAFEELSARFPAFQVDPSRRKRSVLSNVRGVSHLPALLGARA